MKSLALLLVSFSCLSVAACGGEEKRPPRAPVAVEPPPPPPAAPARRVDDGKNPNRAQLNIAEDIRKACGIADEDAYFDFDSANIRPQDHKVLSQLAKCFSSGPLAGRKMGLVGHADPRGEDEYNMLLGEKRAASVRNAIAAEGLALDKMNTTSRGEMDATGTDEATWSRDRRVDVVLAD
jgi:peptidoglycan-associated lipoprotein